MTEPPAYPRIPYLVGHPSRPSDDDVLSVRAREALLSSACIVEEKLDGANVCVWKDGDEIRAVGRGGAGAMDRGGQLGRLRAWIADRDAELRAILAPPIAALYGEWLWRTHTVRYEQLPDLLIVIDVLGEDGAFSSVAFRDRACARARLPTPPRLFSGVPHTLSLLEGLSGPSRFGAPALEGLVVRTESADALVPRAKMLARGFRRVTDAEWHSRGLVLNKLAGPEQPALRASRR